MQNFANAAPIHAAFQNASPIHTVFQNAAPIHAAFQDAAQFMQHFSFYSNKCIILKMLPQFKQHKKMLLSLCSILFFIVIGASFRKCCPH